MTFMTSVIETKFFSKSIVYNVAISQKKNTSNTPRSAKLRKNTGGNAVATTLQRVNQLI